MGGFWGAELPNVELVSFKEFDATGDYARKDDLSARITAEGVEVLPNGNLVLEARTHVKTDAEESVIELTGVCRQDDVTAANTLISSQIHDLTISKMHAGDVKDNATKGIISKVLDAIFAW